MLQEQTFITQIPTQPVRAVFSEGQDGLVDDFDGLSDFILLDDEGRRQADDVAVRGLGQQPVVAEAQTHLPGVVVCKGREGEHQQGTEGTPSTAQEVSQLQHGLLFASWQMQDARRGHSEQLCGSTQSSAPSQPTACLALRTSK